MKTDTPIFNECYKECLDDTGNITRLEPLYEGFERLERDFNETGKALNAMALRAARLQKENQYLEEAVSTLNYLCKTAEIRCLKKLQEERAAAMPNVPRVKPNR